MMAEAAATIDEIPLDWCYRPGVKLDFRALPDGHVVSAAEIEAELTRIGHTLQPLDIVVVNTAAGKRYGQPDYVNSGMRDGARSDALLDLPRRARHRHRRLVMGCPIRPHRRRYAATKDASIIWEGHKAGREIGYCHIEKLHNLEILPATGFLVACFPVKIRRASAGWTRAVAILND